MVKGTYSGAVSNIHAWIVSEPDIQFVIAADQSAVLGGGILNRGAGVVGISNVFADEVDPGAIFEGLAHFTRSTFPGLPIVAYEQQSERLKGAYHAGFSPIGHLRVWSRG